MIKKYKILLLTNKDSKNKILKILKNNFKGSKITIKIFSKPGLSTGLQLKKKYFDYIFSFRSFLILNSKMLNKAKLACINFHPAPPKYRGRGGINYALYKNEKRFGVTAHIIDKQIDHGKIILVKYFKIPKNCSVEKLFTLTLNNLYIIANIIFKKLKNNVNSLNNMIEKNKSIKWSKKFFNTKDMNNFYKLNVNSSKKDFVKKIKATSYKNYKPYLQIHGFKFYLN